MNYVRTKDGRIYEIIEETETGFELCSPFEKKIGCNCIMIKRTLGNNEKSTYRTADTIEELCDEFVLIKRGEPELFVRNNDEIAKHYAFESFVKFNLPHSNKITDIYGAIWTDKGLIYVAKMNEKGELELL